MPRASPPGPKSCPSRTGLHSDTIEARVRVLVVVAGVPPPARAAPALSVARSQSPWFEHGACSRTLDATASFKVHCGTSQASPGSVDSHSNVPRAGLPPCGACASTGAGAHSSKVTSHPSVVWEQDAFWTVGSELIARPHVAASSTAGSSTLAEEPEAQPAVDLAARRRRDGQRDRARHLVLRQRVVAARAVDLLAGGARHARLADAERGERGWRRAPSSSPGSCSGPGRPRARPRRGRRRRRRRRGGAPSGLSFLAAVAGVGVAAPFFDDLGAGVSVAPGEALLFWSSSSGWLLVRLPTCMVPL